MTASIIRVGEVWKLFCGLQNKLQKALLFITKDLNGPSLYDKEWYAMLIKTSFKSHIDNDFTKTISGNINVMNTLKQFERYCIFRKYCNQQSTGVWKRIQLSLFYCGKVTQNSDGQICNFPVCKKIFKWYHSMVRCKSNQWYRLFRMSENKQTNQQNGPLLTLSCRDHSALTLHIYLVCLLFDSINAVQV